MRITDVSAGLNPTLSPQTKQPPVVSTTRRIAVMSRATFVRVSIVSAVPAGDVIALDEVFGIFRPKQVTMETTIGVVRLPGRPPIQCLS